jgi:kanamycin kinase
VRDTNDPAVELIEVLGAEQSAVLICTNFLGGRTFRLGAPGAARYLKIAPLTVPDTHDLTVEAERLRWIGDRFPVPHVLDAGRTDSLTWMLTEELPGITAADPRWRSDPRRTARILGGVVRTFHDALADRVAECPWSWRISDRLGAGTGSPEARSMARTPPEESDFVVAHGDLCAPNILLLADGRLGGFTDLGKLGVAARAADLGCHVWSLQFNDMGGHAEEFLTAYGYEGDPAEVWWYRDYYTVV